MKPRHWRLLGWTTALALLLVGSLLLRSVFEKNLVFFYTPTQVISGEAPVNAPLRIGGLVEVGSLRREADGLGVHFTVTDGARSLPVSYRGLLPDLFREGQGVVAQGRLGQGLQFDAQEVLARHDENYMPPEAAGALTAATRQPHGPPGQGGGTTGPAIVRPTIQARP
jgi:cytochrome c-type biogenesis protein CcmE